MPTTGVPHRFPVALNGRTYMVDTREGRYKQRSIPLQRAQTDISESVGEQSLNTEDLWRRSFESWHRGAGQTYFDQSDSDPARFRSSLGVDPWTRGEMTLLLATESKKASTNTNLRLAVAGDRLYVIDGQTLSYTIDVLGDGASGWVTVTGTPAEAATFIATDGFNVYVGYGASGIYKTDRTSEAASSFATGTVTGPVEYVKGRLMAANANVVYNVTVAAAVSGQVLFTHPNTDFEWVGFAEGFGDIYAAGYSGDKSLIYKTQVRADGTALDIPTVAGRLPDGEIIRSIYGYLGFLFAGTDRGLRMAQSDADGNLIFGALIRTPRPVRCFEGQGQYVWFGYEDIDADPFSDASGLDDGTSYDGLGRLDLTQLILPLTPAHATDIYAAASDLASERVLSVVTFQYKRVFTVVDLGGYETIMLRLDPESWWRFGEPSGTTATDEMGLTNLTYNNAPTLAVAGALDDDTAVSFDGSNDDATSTGFTPTLAAGASLVAWFKKASAPGSNSAWFVKGPNTTGRDIGLWVRSSGGGGGAQARMHNSGGTEFSITGSTNICDGEWHFIVATWDGSNFRLYVDGQLEAGPTAVASLRDSGDGVAVAVDAVTGTSNLLCSVDEPAIFARALTADEVAELYDAGVDGISVSETRGVYAETADRVDFGFLRSGLVAYGISDVKVATYMDMLTKPNDGEVGAYLAANEGTFTLVDSTITDSSTTETYTVGSVRGDRHEVLFKLSRDANAPLGFHEGRGGEEPQVQEAPAIVRLTLRSEPAPKRGRIFEVPLLLHSVVVDLNGHERYMDVDAELALLHALFTTQTLIPYEDRSVSTSVFLRDVVFEAEMPTPDKTFWQGTCTVVLKEPGA